MNEDAWRIMSQKHFTTIESGYLLNFVLDSLTKPFRGKVVSKWKGQGPSPILVSADYHQPPELPGKIQLSQFSQ